MDSKNLILHHYPLSPYSAKIRAMLGYTQSDWSSVITAEAPPRPQLHPLTGGYRKIPVAQIGADVFCDTRVISREIARLSGCEALLPESLTEEAVALMRRAEDELFFACGLAATGLTIMVKTFKMLSLAGYINFMRDRIAMGKDISVPMPGLKESKRMVMQHLNTIETQLHDDFLYGDTPNLADFSVYHGLWMIQVLGEKKFIHQFPNTIAWMKRIMQFGDGQCVIMDADKALDIAHDTVAREILPEYQQDDSIGALVSIAPDDYAKDATQGILQGVTPATWILARDHDRVGTVNVHFPKQGYEITIKARSA